MGFGFRVLGLGFGVWGLGFGVWSLWFRVQGLRFGVWGLGVWGFGGWGLRFRVEDAWGRTFGVGSLRARATPRLRLPPAHHSPRPLYQHAVTRTTVSASDHAVVTRWCVWGEQLRVCTCHLRTKIVLVSYTHMLAMLRLCSHIHSIVAASRLLTPTTVSARGHADDWLLLLLYYSRPRVE